MKNQKRLVPSVLAVCLLASLGTLVVAQPAAAQSRWDQASRAAIERFTLRSDGRMAPGEDVRFRLEGTPGARAWVDVPGVVNGLELRETRPGSYEGSYTVRRQDNPNAFAQATATLRSGRDQATAYVDARGGDRRDEHQRYGRDERAPQVTEVSPANGQNLPEGRVQISARLSDEGSGVDARSVRLRVNGRDVTDEARINAGEVQYRADLRPGRYTAEVMARDNAGNPVTRAWTFDVMARVAVAPVPVPPPRVVVPAPVPPVAVVPPPVYSGPLTLAVTNLANGAIVNAGDNVRLEGQTAPHANVRVQVDNQMATGAMTKLLDQTVTADGTGRFSVDFSPSGFVIPGVRYDVRLTSMVGSRAVEQRLTLQRRQG
jgi:hypothetical protein